MAKDKKAKAAAKKARVAEKTEKKAAKKEKKASTKPKKGADADSDDDSQDDLDALLASYAAQQEQFLAVTETVVPDPPSPRSSATLIANPANASELLLFGGEHYNGGLARFFNDLFVYNIPRDEWRLVTSPNTPLPRSGHAWTRGGNQASTVWLFGGEFSSPKQGTFYHYGDFWKLDAGPGKEWEKIEAKGKDRGPPSRSGHRMTYFKQYIVLFGGFQDTSNQTKYLNDLWLYDTSTFQWFQPTLPPASPKPDPRSSFTLLPHDAGAVMYGGYSRVKATATSGGGGKSSKAHTTSFLKPMVHTDAWFLRITPPPADKASAANTPPTVRWERRKKPTNTPQPPRAGATMTAHKGRGIQFGGVHDVEDSEEGIDSDFFNSLGVWNVERNRYFELGLRRQRQPKKQADARPTGRGARGKRDEEELLANLRALELKAAGKTSDEVEQAARAAADAAAREAEPDEPARPEKPTVWEMPHPRFNAQLTVQDDMLYIFGGTFEKGDREYTFDEMWAIDLGKMDGVKQIFHRELQDWQGDESSSEDEDDEDQDDEDDDDDNEAEPEPAVSESQPVPETPTAPAGDDNDEDTTADEPSPEEVDPLPHPRPFEALRDFYARTSNTWQELVMDKAQRGASQFAPSQSVKEIRTSAFELAEEKWWDCREEVQALEDEQDESGIHEVVNLAEKTGGGVGTVGRRR